MCSIGPAPGTAERAIVLARWRQCLPSAGTNRCLLWPTQIYPTDVISIDSTIFAQLTREVQMLVSRLTNVFPPKKNYCPPNRLAYLVSWYGTLELPPQTASRLVSF